ncbi:Dorsal-ventral patterning protein tolloid [Gryllus bimaculatus]|nr:Dorsal-ventral patterning protein tolloid [Gryllus bimaculatus]
MGTRVAWVALAAALAAAAVGGGAMPAPRLACALPGCEQLEPPPDGEGNGLGAGAWPLGPEPVDIPLGRPDEVPTPKPLGTAIHEMNVPGEPLTPEDYANAEKIGVYERSVIAASFLEFHRLSCIRFVPRTSQLDYIYLQKGVGCSSHVGRSGSGQPISLAPGCVYKGIVIHELLHALGFWHEQSRGDRDDYVTVLWHNIQRGMEHNFQKFSWNVMQTLGMPYDTGSVMHYGMYSFSRDRRSPTIVPRKPGIQVLGQRRGFSKPDLLKLNKLYECQGRDPSLPSPTPVRPPSKPHICSDNSHLCRYWANIGECQKNPTWMRVNCPVSCKECGTCSNYNKLCVPWAERGECIKNPSYMTIYCAEACRSCKTSSTETSDCINQNKYCEAWARDGQCQINPSYMLKFCKKSCKEC